MNLSDLRAEVRELIGYGAYDRLFSDAMANNAINFACSQVAELMGVTRVDVLLAVIGKKVNLPTDVARVIAAQIGTTTYLWPGPFIAAWDVPEQEGFLDLPLIWQVDVQPFGGPGPITYAWAMTPSGAGTVTFSGADGPVAVISGIDIGPGEYLDVSCTVAVPGQEPQVLSQAVQFVGV